VKSTPYFVVEEALLILLCNNILQRTIKGHVDAVRKAGAARKRRAIGCNDAKAQ
jgi:hypothetical protein